MQLLFTRPKMENEIVRVVFLLAFHHLALFGFLLNFDFLLFRCVEVCLSFEQWIAHLWFTERPAVRSDCLLQVLITN